MTAKLEKKPTNTRSSKKHDEKPHKRKHQDFDPKKSKKNNNTNAAADDDDTTPANKKRALKKERQSHRRHYNEITHAKEIWNKLRVKTNDDDTIKKLMTELMTLLEGRMVEVALQHDASRVVQSAIQFGNAAQRNVILKELKGSIPQLSKFQYSHFVVLKLIKFCGRDGDGRKIIVKSLKGHLTKLATHAVGARVVELLLATFPPHSTILLRQEFYGPQFALFSSGEFSTSTRGSSLREILSPTKNAGDDTQKRQRAAILSHVVTLINKGCEKGLYHFTYFQNLIWDYISCDAIATRDVRALASSLVDNTLFMLSTRNGARVMAQCAAYGTVKDRRRMLKALKGYSRSSLLHEDAYICVLRLCNVTDDTVSIQKCLLNEVLVHGESEATTSGTKDGDKMDVEEDKSPLLDLALSDTASKLFLLLLSPRVDSTHFDPWELEMLLPSIPTVEEKGEIVPTCKKDADTRRTELIMVLRNGLEELCKTHVRELMTSICGSKVLNAFYRAFPSEELAEAIVGACRDGGTGDGAAASGAEGDETLSMFENPVGHVCVKNMLMAEVNERYIDEDVVSFKKKKESKADSDTAEGSSLLPMSDTMSTVSFAEKLYDAFQGQLMTGIASSNRGAFVLATLASVEKVHDNVKAEVTKSMKQVKLKGEKENVKGYKALLDVIKK